jgi:hypothetical protein
MNSNKDELTGWGFSEFAALLCDGHGSAQNRLRSRGSQADHDSRLQDRDLGLKPGLACYHFPHGWLLVEAALAAPYPFEMLDRVGDVNLLAGDAGLRQSLVEHPSRRSDKGTSLAIFLIARLLANQHQIRVRGANPKNRLSRALVEIAPFAGLGRFAKRFQRWLLGQEVTR